MPEQIYVNGNTYTLGATVGPISGTGGSTSYFFGNLNSGTTYYFVVVSYNYAGYSGYAGPISVYTPQSGGGESREPILAFAWDWPHSPVYSSTVPSQLLSTSSENIFPLSNEIIVDDPWLKINSIKIGKNQNAGASAPPAGIIPYAISAGVTNDYVALYNIQNSLVAGNTYTLSFYHEITSGMTGLGYRIIRNPQNDGGIPMRQILPVSDASYSSDPTYGEKALNYGTGLTGWQRFALQFIPGTTQTDLKIYIFSKTATTAGLSAYIAGPQLTKGQTATDFISTGVVAEWNGNCAAQGYSFNDALWLSESNTRGWSYISPMVNFSGQFARKPTYTNGWTLSSTVNRAASLLKQLPEKKRAILPVYFFTEAPWFHYSDGVSFDRGYTYTFYNNLYETTQTQKVFPTIWPLAGISMAQNSFTSLMQTFSATGASVAYLISNMELFGEYGSFAIAGYSGFKDVMRGLTQYAGSYLGLSGFSAWMYSMGATISDIGWEDQITRGDDYLVWEGIQRGYINRALDEIYSSIQTYFPNSTRLEYEWSYVSEGAPLAGAPDINGHPQWFQYLFGNAASPQLYGWMGGIASGSFGICGSDPTYLDFNPSAGYTLPAKSAWTSFMMGLQTVRSAKRGSPNTPITPWIASIRFPGGDYAYPGGSADAPQVGFADMHVGWNPWQGYTLNNESGNSLYYYEMVKHVALHGVKAFPYWNTWSFVNEDAPKVGGSTQANTIFAGDTGYVRDMTELNNALLEVNQRLGGFTLTTGDTTRIAWNAPWVASGAPGLNGTTWWWRITANPDYIVTVDGNTQLGATGPGLWIGSTGATIGVDISSSPVLAPM